MVQIKFLFLFRKKNFCIFFLKKKLGKKWHDRRKITAPAFHFKMVEKFTETFDRLGNLFIDKLSEYSANNEDIEFFHLNRLHTLDVVCGMIF